MEHVDVTEIDSLEGPADVKRPLTDPLGATDVALNYYELAPGDSFAFGYHAHSEQEELFYVQSGTVTFETEAGPVEVGPGEVVRFAPGEYQRGVNEDDERVVALALGAPAHVEEDVDVRRDCPECDERTTNDIRRREDDDELVTICDVCGTETERFD